MVTVSSALVERIESRHEAERKARSAYEARVSRKNHHGRDALPNRDRPFIGWDGEGPRDAGYALFGNSLGYEICRPYLSTRECLDLILDCEQDHPESIHIWFGSNYDVSMILRELSWRHLSALKHWSCTIWDDYDLQHIPNKWLRVSKNGVTAKLYDIQSFFGGSYVNALLNMKIGTEDEIALLTAEKARRSSFLFSEIDEIREYWRLELRLMPLLAGTLRTSFVNAGFDLTSWHGPGAIANLAMRRHDVAKAKAETPVDVQIASRYAFAGGRFEMFRGGYIERTIYNADIRSAYPYFATFLPNLANGKWRRGRDYEPDKFAVYRIAYHNRNPDPLTPYPLFRRLTTGEVVWEANCEGWYWGPEAELVAGDPDATFQEAWIFDENDPSDRPFAWLQEYYDRRQYLKKIGSNLEYTYKLIINSVYGQLAQRAGWDRRRRLPPRSHQLEWAGYITSGCRAKVHTMATAAGANLISIDTDGVFATCPLETGNVGVSLGDWETAVYDTGIFWQSGIYALNRKTDWVKGKTRGITKGAYQPQDLIDALARNEPLRLMRNQFTGYGLALNGQRDKLNTWSTELVELQFGGQGKRYHNEKKWCQRNGHCANGIHEFIARPTRWNPADSTMSVPHFLPWIGGDSLAASHKRIIDDMTIFDVNHLDTEDEWVRAL
jgi:hypothetical protein